MKDRFNFPVSMDFYLTAHKEVYDYRRLASQCHTLCVFIDVEQYIDVMLLFISNWKPIYLFILSIKKIGLP